MVYTPHSNLKKTFEMDSGTMTYHDTKLYRYGRCNKDRARIRQLERTKSRDVTVDFYKEFRTNQRNMIERKRRERQQQQQQGMADGGKGGDELYNPMLDDLKALKRKTK